MTPDAAGRDLEACLKNAEQAMYQLGLAIQAAVEILRTKPAEQPERITR